MLLKKLHHVAYRCQDAQATVDFYTKLLGLKFAHAIIQDAVPSIGLNDPHTHIFFEMEDGSFIAFFDIIGSDDAIPEAERDWAQHLALEVKNMETLLDARTRLQVNSIDVVGPTDHGFCQSIYFFDPSGHRLEMTVRTEADTDRSQWEQEAYASLAQWNEKKAIAN